MTAPAPRVRRVLSRRRKLAYGTFVGLLFFAFLETTARLFWTPSPLQGRDVGTRRFITWLSNLSLQDSPQSELYQPHASRGWALVPGTHQGFNYHFAKGRERQPIQITINPSGYRGPEAITDTSSIHQVLCLGDSNLFGYPLDDRFTFPAVLGKELNRDRPQTWITLNGGIPGYTTHQGRKWYAEAFSQLEYDWLILSYLNNDAWQQPQVDRITCENPWADSWVNQLAGKLRCIQFAQSKLPQPAKVARVPLEEFQENYQYFIGEAKCRKAKVLILDFCIYENYQAYSTALEGLSADGVIYYHVAQHAVDAIRHGWHESAPKELRDAVHRRWGRQILEGSPMLWMYAEFYPEHLNEIGTLWLAKEVRKIVDDL